MFSAMVELRGSLNYLTLRCIARIFACHRIQCVCECISGVQPSAADHFSHGSPNLQSINMDDPVEPEAVLEFSYSDPFSDKIFFM